MEITGERYVPGQSGVIELEHFNRYYFVVSQIDLHGKTVLDIASGEGYGSYILSKYSKRVIGIDISKDAVDYAAHKYNTGNLEFLHGNIIDIPLKDESVDIVVSFETIEHHDKHLKMMDEIKRIFKKKGGLSSFLLLINFTILKFLK